MKTLETILSAPRFNDLILLTDPFYLNIVVNNVEITETPDIANYIPSQTLILTTAMYYKDHPDDLCELIDSLALIHCAGLCIKVGRFINDIPDKVVQHANKRHVALIQCPSTIPLGTVQKELMSYLSETKEAEITYALDMQKKFSTLFLHNATLQRIIKEFGKATNLSIMLLNPFKDNIALSDNWEEISNTSEMIIEHLKEQDAFQNNKNMTTILDIPTQPNLDIAVYPIKSYTYFPYYLVILSKKNILYPVTKFAIDQALMVLSFTILKNDKLYEASKLRKSEWFFDLINRQKRNIFTEKEWLNDEKNMGLKVSQSYQLSYVRIQKEKQALYTTKRHEEKQKLTYEWLDTHLKKEFPNAVVFMDKETNDNIILLQEEISTKKLEQLFIYFNHKIKKNLPIEPLFSCGQSYSQIDFLVKSLNEAKLIDKERGEQNITAIFSIYQPKGITRLLDNIDKEEAKNFCLDTLKFLSAPQSEMDIELRKTLKTFLDNQCEITKTANELFIHRNTVKYRIDNIEELLGCKIDTPENSLKLRLALELSEP